MASKNSIYLVEVGPGQLKSFDNWPDCQDFVSGKPYAFAGGPDRASAEAKLKRRWPNAPRAAQPPVAFPPRHNPEQSTKSQATRPTPRSAAPEQGDAKPKNNIYLVETAPGEYRKFTRWPECKAFVEGKKLAFAGGVDEASALEKLRTTREWQLARHGSPAAKAQPGTRPTQGLASDAGTHGNPGPCEFQVTDLKGTRLLHRHLGVHSNNYAELAGIEGMIQVAIERGESMLWTDSKIAMGWIRTRRLGPTVHEPDQIMLLIHRINDLLRANPQLRLLKWETRVWGEIPADFGRK